MVAGDSDFESGDSGGQVGLVADLGGGEVEIELGSVCGVIGDDFSPVGREVVGVAFGGGGSGFGGATLDEVVADSDVDGVGGATFGHVAGDTVGGSGGVVLAG